MAGIPLPTDREIDGVDILPLMQGDLDESPHEELYFVSTKKVMGLRTKDNFKYLDKHRSENSTYWVAKQGPFLFNLNQDQNESYNASTHFPEKTADMSKKLEDKRKEMVANPRGWKR